MLTYMQYIIIITSIYLRNGLISRDIYYEKLPLEGFAPIMLFTLFINFVVVTEWNIHGN